MEIITLILSGLLAGAQQQPATEKITEYPAAGIVAGMEGNIVHVELFWLYIQL